MNNEIIHHIQVTDSVASIIRESSTKRIEEIEREIKRLLHEEKGLRDIISQLDVVQSEVNELEYNNAIQVDDPILDGYKSAWTWIKKAQYIIRHIGPSTTTQIVEALMGRFEKDIKKPRTTIVASISAILSARSKGKNILFIKSENDAGENVYDIVR